MLEVLKRKDSKEIKRMEVQEMFIRKKCIASARQSERR
jgi:hypothetical protein